MKFTVEPIDQKVFMILKEDSMDEIVHKKLPLEVYGFIRIDGEEYLTSSYSCMNIAEEVTVSGELAELAEEARLQIWDID